MNFFLPELFPEWGFGRKFFSSEQNLPSVGKSFFDDNDHIGSMECSLGEVLAADGAGLTRQLVGEKADQTITLVAEELVASREVVKLKLVGKKLERKDWCGFGSSDPFLTILRANEPGRWFVVHRTEVMKGSFRIISLSACLCLCLCLCLRLFIISLTR